MCDRPKSIRSVTVKMPEELYLDLEEQAGLMARVAREGKSVSEVIKDCCEFRMTLLRGLRVGYYVLRRVPLEGQSKSGETAN